MEKYDRKLVAAAVLIAAFLLVGTIFFHTVERWSYLDAFYFSGITLTTIGYGDLTPATALGKIATVVYAFAGIGIVFYSIGILAQRYFEQEEERLHHLWEATTPHRKALQITPLTKQFNKMTARVSKTFSSKKTKVEFRPLDADMRWWLKLRKSKRMPPPPRR